MNEKQKPRVVSLFSGAGGMDIGLIRAGLDIVWANDIFEDAIISYKNNIGAHIVKGDIRNIKSEDIPDCDIVVGGFPCQGFSIANNKRSMKDERNFLYREMLRVIKDKQPSVFIAENVKGILSIEKGKVFEMILNDFRSIGYQVDAKLIDMSLYGIPQKRERVIFIGNKIGVENVFPEPITKNDKFKSKDFISFLRKIDISTNPININTKELILEYDKININNYTPNNILDIKKNKDTLNLYNHYANQNVLDYFYKREDSINQEVICDYLKKWKNEKRISIKEIDKKLNYAYTAGHWFRKDKSGSLPTPSDWIKLKNILGFDDKYDYSMTNLIKKEITFSQSLRIANWETPSDTITASIPEIHIDKQRRLSVRECATIQTFPLDYIFYGSLSNMYKQIGNAIPTFFAYQIGLSIIETLNKQK